MERVGGARGGDQGMEGGGEGGRGYLASRGGTAYGKVNWYEWNFRQGWMKWYWRREERGRGRQEYVDEWEQEREGEGEQKVWVVAAKCV